MPVMLLATVALAAISSAWWWIAAGVLLALWPLRIAQLARRQRARGLRPRIALASALLLMVGKVRQVIGLLGYHFDRLSGRASRLIDYKGPVAA